MKIYAWNVRHDKTREYEVPSVQFTYEMLRVGDTEFAVYLPDCQVATKNDISFSPDGWVFHDGFIASDFTVHE